MTVDEKLLPCPFCGSGETMLHYNTGVWRGVEGYGEPISVEVRHWCADVEGNPKSRLLALVGRDKETAIAKWNTRAKPSLSDDGSIDASKPQNRWNEDTCKAVAATQRADERINDLMVAANKDIRKITGIRDVDMRVRKPLSDDARQMLIQSCAQAIYAMVDGDVSELTDPHDIAKCVCDYVFEHFDLVER